MNSFQPARTGPPWRGVPLRFLFATVANLAWSAQGANYYVSAATGDDAAAGTSEETAWRTFAKASGADLSPGDQLLFKSGDRFQGMLSVDAQGEKDREIIIGAYGKGSRPFLDGQGEEACVRLHNPAHVVVRGLELTNEDGRFGVRLTGRNAGALGRVTVEDMDIHGIYKKAWDEPENSGHGSYKYYGGINAEILRGDQPTWWEGIVIRNCDLHDLGTCGISIGSGYSLHEKRRARRGQSPYPIKGVLIERNTFRDIARDGAIIRQCQGAVMQHNDVIRTGRVSISNGIWFWDCQDSVIRYNLGTECGARGQVDGGPFSIDYFCRDCVIENNYSHDNEGPGFMAFGNNQTGTGSVLRNNVSYNDATARMRPGFAAVSMISTLSETLVENNTVIAGPDTTVLLGHHDWQGLPTDVAYRGNVFIGNGTAAVESSVLRGGTFESNVFLDVPALPEGVGVKPVPAEKVKADAEALQKKFMAEVGRHAPRP